MRYWDSSALVPLILDEPETGLVRDWLAGDAGIVTWAWTRVEVTSAVERRAREGHLTARQRRDALDRFAALADDWDEITDILAVRIKAGQLLARHSLRAADSAQLAAALLFSDPDPTDLPFVCFDERLANAAEREGFRVLSSLSG